MTGPNRPTRPGMRWGSARLRVPLLGVLCWLAAVTPALATILDEPESLTEGSDGFGPLPMQPSCQSVASP